MVNVGLVPRTSDWSQQQSACLHHKKEQLHKFEYKEMVVCQK